MIRLAILSDLHIEKGDWRCPALDADLVVLAGDVGWGAEGLAWIARELAGRPAVTVAGNREYWHHGAGVDPVERLRRGAAAIPNLLFLQDEAVEVELAGGAVRLLGSTLWGDFTLDGDVAGSVERAGATMPDYQHGNGPGGRPLTPALTLAANHASTAFLAGQLARPFDGPTVVVTHHVPSELSLKVRKPGNVPQCASVSHLEALIAARGPNLWVHGHTHWDCDYRIGRTRVVSRQRGGPDNEGFTPLVVEI